MATIAVVTIKRFASAKQRLRDDASVPGLRPALAESMMCDVLIALRRSLRIDEVLVVTGEPRAAPLAVSYGAAAVIHDEHDAGHVEAALLGIKAAVERGAARVLLLPGDCPLLDPSEVDELLAQRANGAEVVVIPDRDGSGTNGLLLHPPDVIAPAFGEGSRERHLALARSANAPARVAALPSLGLDIDRADDFEALRDLLARRRGQAAMTRGLLAQAGRL